MRYSTLAEEFESMIEALRQGKPQAMRAEAKKLRAKLVACEASLLDQGRDIDDVSYDVGALEAAAELLMTTAGRTERTAALADLRTRDQDLLVLHQLGRWAVVRLTAGEAIVAQGQSQKALANAVNVAEATLSRKILPRLVDAGFIRKPVRGKSSSMVITDAGIAALDQVKPGWPAIEPGRAQASDSFAGVAKFVEIAKMVHQQHRLDGLFFTDKERRSKAVSIEQVVSLSSSISPYHSLIAGAGQTSHDAEHPAWLGTLHQLSQHYPADPSTYVRRHQTIDNWMSVQVQPKKSDDKEKARVRA
jgi:hypothetical protein